MFHTEYPINYKDKMVSFILIWSLLCDPLHEKLSGIRYKNMHSISQTFDTYDKGRCASVYNSFDLSLISTSMFYKYFQIFAKWEKCCWYILKAKVQKFVCYCFLATFVTISWWIFVPTYLYSYPGKMSKIWSVKQHFMIHLICLPDWVYLRFSRWLKKTG